LVPEQRRPNGYPHRSRNFSLQHKENTFYIFVMKIKTLIYSVLICLAALPGAQAFAQSTAATAQPPVAAQAAVSAQPKRIVNPESIKRAKLTRLRKDVALTDDQATKVRPIIDAYVNDLQTIKTDASLDAHTKRQKMSAVRQKYDGDLGAVLTLEQQQKLASLKEERRARLRAARTGSTSVLEPAGSRPAPAIIQ
jgi:Spy/CpxP family protein refolding chaperone